MCGVSGIFHYAGGTADPDVVSRMTDVMVHRGPDDGGLWADGSVALGHRRLSVIDLSAAGHQPMCNPDASLFVTYNGELYGWPEIRSELAGRGHRFQGTSDTEALLHLYEELGDDMFVRLRGMFAFGLYDRPRRRLLLGRDRLGIKPLYYHDDGRRVVFASELKALLQDRSVRRDVDPVAIADYLTFQSVPTPRSILAGVRKLPAGCYLVVDENGAREQRYWSLPVDPQATQRDLGADYYREGLRALLTEAVRLRLVSDVPLGAFLSGGIDSSAVVALMRQESSGPVRTFSVGFDVAGFSELEHARQVAEHLGTEHTELIVRPSAMDLLPRLVWQLDEPFADASAIPTYYVSEAARRYVTVALSGDGGDETFGGYDTYGFARSYHRADVLPRALRRALALPARWLPGDHPLGRRLRRVAMDVVDRHLDVTSLFPKAELPGVLSSELRAAVAAHDPMAAARGHYNRARPLGELAALLHLDAETYMIDDVLTKVDRASMLTSLEVRVPLLDHKVQEFAARIPFQYKLRGDVRKWVFKESVRDLLPPSILARGKQGFGVPLAQWLGSDFGRLAREVLLDDRARARGWVDPRGVQTLLEGGQLRREHRATRLWALVCLELWAQCFLDRPAVATRTPLTTVRPPSSNALAAS
jgi:asparagine synthase (glutamine-hydrolysing)